MPKPPENEPAKMETMTWAQIYNALDARARDLRAVMLACLAGSLASLASFVNALPEGHPAPAVTLRLCYFFVTTIVLAGAGLICCLQTRRTVKRAEYVRTKFKNYADVPVVDRFLQWSEILRPREFKLPDDIQ